MKHKQKKRAFPSLRKQVFLSCSAIVIICGLFMFYIIRFSEIQIKNVYFDKTLELLVKESEKLSGKLENLQGHILTLLSSPEFDEVRKRMNRPQQAKETRRPSPSSPAPSKAWKTATATSVRPLR